MNESMKSVTRRGFMTGAGAAGGAAWLGWRPASGQGLLQEPALVTEARAAAAAAKITTMPLRGGLSALMGSGGNIAVLTGREGKLLVDSGLSSSRRQILEALAVLSVDPMKHLINTHWHYDHTDGNEWMHSNGAVILAQAKTKVRLSEPQPIAAFGVTFPPAPVGARPTKTFSEDQIVTLNGEKIVLRHYAAAHTDTDISVHFTQADVLHCGDTWFNGIYPFIDYSTGGNINGVIAAAEWNLKAAGADTTIVPGHGPIGNKTELAAYQEVLVTARDRVAAMKKDGKSLTDVVAAKPMAAYDETWGSGFVKPEMFLGLVYQGV